RTWYRLGSACPSDETIIMPQNLGELRCLTWNHVGIVRIDSWLLRAARRGARLEEETHEYYWEHLVTRDLLELRNIQTVAELIIASAASRRESRGLHFTMDHQVTRPELARDTVAKRGVPPHLRGA